MPNEIRPRRETSSTSRIRKTVAPSAAPAGDEPVGAPPAFSKAGESAIPATDKPRDRQDREPYREEGPADREPIRFIRQREREPVREPVVEREPVLTVRERLARDRAERDGGGPVHHEGIPMARDRERERDPAPPVRERSRDQDTGGPSPGPVPPSNYRERPERDMPYIAPREREYVPPARAERPAPSSQPYVGITNTNEFPDVEDDIFGDAEHSTTVTKTSSAAARSTSPSFQKMTMPQLIRTAKDRRHHRLHGAEKAGPDLQDLERAGQAKRIDVR